MVRTISNPHQIVVRIRPTIYILAPIIFAFERQDENGPVIVVVIVRWSLVPRVGMEHCVAIWEIFRGVFFIDLGIFVDFMFVWHFDGCGYRCMVTYQG